MGRLVTPAHEVTAQGTSEFAGFVEVQGCKLVLRPLLMFTAAVIVGWRALGVSREAPGAVQPAITYAICM
jgi:hypothetical protein